MDGKRATAASFVYPLFDATDRMGQALVATAYGGAQTIPFTKSAILYTNVYGGSGGFGGGGGGGRSWGTGGGGGGYQGGNGGQYIGVTTFHGIRVVSVLIFPQDFFLIQVMATLLFLLHN